MSSTVSTAADARPSEPDITATALAGPPPTGYVRAALEGIGAWRRAATAPEQPLLTIQGILGKGSQGMVLRAQDADCRRALAVKLLHPHRRTTADRQQFLREIHITAQLEHPGIVPVHEVGILPDGTPFYTMKQVEGITLADIMQRDGVPGPRQRVAVLQQVVKVCDTLAFAHHRGVVHRDLKPRNLMVGRFGEVLVLDWGLARVMGTTDPADPITLSSPSHGDSEIGYAIGTPGYMSPEQARGLAADARSDLYAVGVILYRLLTGDSPYRSGSSREILAQAAAGDWRPLTDHPVGRRLPRRLQAIIHRCMAVHPEERYATAAAVAEDLRRFLEDRAVAACRETPWAAAGRELLRHRRLVMATAVTLALAASVWGLHAFREAREQAELRQRLAMQVRAAEREGRWDDARRDGERWQDLEPANREVRIALDRIRRAQEWRQAQHEQEERGREAEQLVHAANEVAARGTPDDIRQAILGYQRALGLAPHDAAAQMRYREAVGTLAVLQQHAEEDRRQRARRQEADALVRQVEAALAAGQGHAAQQLVERMRGVDAQHPEIERLTTATTAVVAAQQARQAAELLAQAAQQGQAVVHLEEQLAAWDVERQGAVVALQESPSTAMRQRVQTLESRMQATREQQSQTLARQLELLHHAHVAAPHDMAPAEALADYWADRLREAEHAGDHAALAAAQAQARVADVSGRYRALTEGRGFCDVPATASPVWIRPLRPGPDRTWQPEGAPRALAPGTHTEVASGRWLVEREPGTAQAVRVERGGTCTLALPAATLPRGVALIPGGRLYGRDGAPGAWVGTFALAVHEVTLGEWLEFLADPEVLHAYDAALAQGQLRLVPREQYQATEPLLRRGGLLRQGRFVAERQDGTLVPVQTPVAGISPEDALAYVAWRAKRDGLPWRLPTIDEWTLAVQGGDGRPFPWGDAEDASLCTSGAVTREAWAVGSSATDCSVQGVWDLAGSVAEIVAPAPGATTFPVVGGSRVDRDPARLGWRHRRDVDPRFVHVATGMRLAMDVPR